MKNKIKLLNKLRAAMDSTELMAPVLAPDTLSNNDELGGEGGMAKSDLKSIIRNAQELHDMIMEETDLPEWIQSKITLAADYISSATDYMKSENSEMEEPAEVEEVEEVDPMGLDSSNFDATMENDAGYMDQ